MSARGWPSSLPRRRDMAAALLVLLLAAASAAPLAEAWYEAVDVHLTSNLCTRPHDELFDALHRTMGDNTGR